MIDADKAFFKEYKTKNIVKFLCYAAWVRNETVIFEINSEGSEEN